MVQNSDRVATVGKPQIFQKWRALAELGLPMCLDYGREAAACSARGGGSD